MAAMLAVFVPAVFDERANGTVSGEYGQRRHLDRNVNFNFANVDAQRQVIRSTGRQAPLYGLADVRDRLLLSNALRDASGDCWTLGDEHSGFVTLNRDQEFHDWMLALRRGHRQGTGFRGICRADHASRAISSE